MKTSIKLLVICSIVCIVSSAASAQQKTRKKPGGAHPICKVQSVPSGMVIVGHKANPTCEEGFEFLIKRPATAELVCANSPIPDGYAVDETAGSSACGGENPLTNAFRISSAGGFYGIKVGMTGSDVSDKWGRPVEYIRGKPGSPGGRTSVTWRYRGMYGSMIYIYMDWSPADSEYRVTGIEEIKPKNQ